MDTDTKTPKYYLIDAATANACAAGCFNCSEDRKDLEDLARQPLPQAIQTQILDKAGSLSLVDIVTALAQGQQPSIHSGCNWLSLLTAAVSGIMTDTATALLAKHEEHVSGTWQHFLEYIQATDLLCAQASGCWHLAQPDPDALNARLKAWVEGRLQDALPEAEFAKVKEFLAVSAHGRDLYKGTETPPEPRNPIAEIMEMLGLSPEAVKAGAERGPMVGVAAQDGDGSTELRAGGEVETAPAEGKCGDPDQGCKGCCGHCGGK